jgi:phosphoglucomutase
MRDLRQNLERAVEEGLLLATSVENILQLLERSSNPLYQTAIEELVAGENWSELDDRFFKTLTFGTGGLRGRSIGRVVTKAEQGSAKAGQSPEFPCVGTNAMNFYNVSCATQELVKYIKTQLDEPERPGMAIAHDTRYFSRAFAELAAKIALENGCDVYLFESARSTPELSFAVRSTGATTGVVITASHNPPHDNGYKVYFDDGAQVIEPHASGIIAQVNSVEGEVYAPLPKTEQGQLRVLGRQFDEEYERKLKSLVLRPDLIKQQRGLKIVFTPIHGAGAVITLPLLRSLGFNVSTVEAQCVPDGGFPTVKSPNPENAEALSLGIEQAKREEADLVIATDPDADRMGVAYRSQDGEIRLLTGNQIGSLLAYYRVKTALELGILSNRERGVLLKTFVTTDLQKAIAIKEGLHWVETLTGFKYIGAKLRKYEQALPEEIRLRYRQIDEEESRNGRLEYSHWFVYGGEESYGFSGADFVRDKDGNAAAVMFAEVTAWAKSRGQTLDQLLDEIYLEYGFYTEKSQSLVFEGAEGAEKIRRLAQSFLSTPPTEIDGAAVSRSEDFSKGDVRDSEGDLVPKENMMIFELADGRRVAVRPSGTEPKIKFYLFARRDHLSPESLAVAKAELPASLDRLWDWFQAEAKRRMA